MYRLFKHCVALIALYSSICSINAQDEIKPIPYPVPVGVEIEFPDQSLPKEFKYSNYFNIVSTNMGTRSDNRVSFIYNFNLLYITL